MNQDASTDRSLAEIISDTKEELKQFAQTRIELLRQELREKIKNVKVVAPLAVAALVLLITAYFFIVIALAALVAALFPTNPFRWVFGFAAVGILWALLGGIAAYLTKRELELKTLLPKRTIGVLKSDKDWLQKEVKTEL